MNCVERVKSICKSRGIPISKLEKDLGFSNGYIGQLKKGTFPAERLVKIAEYLDLEQDFLLTGEQKTPADHETDGRSKEFMQLFDRLTPEQKDMILAQLRGVVGNQGK